MNEEFVRVGGIELCYETLGDRGRPTVLLIMGLNLSMDWWRDEFCDALVERGFRVVRFDNRDAGRSTHLAGSGNGIGPWGFVTRRAHPVYTLGDMADDAAGLLDHLGTPAHVVGVSLGSMVAQELAIRHPERTLSLTSIMGRPGDRSTGKVHWRMVPEFLRPGGSDAIENLVRSFRRIGSAGRTAEDDEDVRVTARRAFARERGDGGSRQLAACVGERDRTADLGRLTCPTLVLHGDRDRIIQPSGGRATAAAVPDAELVMVPGMGHDLARWTWPTVLDGITRVAARATV